MNCKRLLSYVRRSSTQVPAPAEWMVEVTNRCNLACPMCLRDKVHFIKQDMDTEFIDRLLEMHPAPKAMWLYGYGEPLIYPHLFETIRLVKQRGIVTCISTNGTHLSEAVGRQLLDSGLDYLIVAFDGASPETYEKYRKGAQFFRTKANVDHFIALKLAGRSNLHLTIQMIRLHETSKESSAFKRCWSRPGVDSVRIREDLLKQEGRTNAVAARSHAPCFFLWRGPLFVQAAGTLIPCPYYHGSESFGDLRSQSAEAAWNSDKMRALRQAHIAGDLSKFPICLACPRHQPHPAIAAASFFVTTGFLRRYLPFLERIQHRFGWKFFE